MWRWRKCRGGHKTVRGREGGRRTQSIRPPPIHPGLGNGDTYSNYPSLHCGEKLFSLRTGAIFDGNWGSEKGSLSSVAEEEEETK